MSRRCSLRSESCASNPRLNNSPITRSSPAGTRDFRFLLFLRLRYRSLVGPPDRIRNSEFVEPRSQAFDGNRTVIALELFRLAPSLLVSHPFVVRAVAHGGPAVAHGDGCVALAAVASRVSQWPQRARRRSRWPPVLRPPTAPAPTIA